MGGNQQAPLLSFLLFNRAWRTLSRPEVSPKKLGGCIEAQDLAGLSFFFLLTLLLRYAGACNPPQKSHPRSTPRPGPEDKGLLGMCQTLPLPVSTSGSDQPRWQVIPDFPHTRHPVCKTGAGLCATAILFFFSPLQYKRVNIKVLTSYLKDFC